MCDITILENRSDFVQRQRDMDIVGLMVFIYPKAPVDLGVCIETVWHVEVEPNK